MCDPWKPRKCRYADICFGDFFLEIEETMVDSDENFYKLANMLLLEIIHVRSLMRRLFRDSQFLTVTF